MWTPTKVRAKPPRNRWRSSSQRGDGRRWRSGRQQQAPDHGGREQQPGQDAGRDVPGECGLARTPPAVRGVFDGSAASTVATWTPGSVTRGAGVPATKMAFAEVSAHQPSSATTVTETNGESAESPVRGSTRWWRARPPRIHRRRAFVDVAIAASVIPSSTIVRAGSVGCSTAIDHDVAPGASPRTRTSPPRFHARRVRRPGWSAVTRSAASPCRLREIDVTRQRHARHRRDHDDTVAAAHRGAMNADNRSRSYLEVAVVASVRKAQNGWIVETARELRRARRGSRCQPRRSVRHGCVGVISSGRNRLHRRSSSAVRCRAPSSNGSAPPIVAVVPIARSRPHAMTA